MASTLHSHGGCAMLRLRPVHGTNPGFLQCHSLRVNRCKHPQACRAQLQQASDMAALHDTGPGAGLLLKTLRFSPVVGEVAEGLEAPIQLIYLATLLGFLVVGAYLVVRQVLIRRELEEAAKTLGERARQSDATSEDYFELGVILLRKKLYTQATKNLEKAKKTWRGEPDELAQVHNALGFAYLNMERNELAIKAYQQAVELQPGYVTAWNNLGDALEKQRQFREAFKAYEEALSYAPENKVARARADALRTRASVS